MHLYHATLNVPTTITSAILGNFTGVKQQELLIVRAQSYLELLKPDTDTGKIATVWTQHSFGVIRQIQPFRLTGATKDYVALTGDAGQIIILEWVEAKRTFVKIHQETFGKTGCRRIVPGEYLAVDPKGRAIMVGAMEKQKFVYILNRDASTKLTISSPLEAHKHHTLTWSIAGVDVGFENPIFAAIELDYHAESDPLERDETRKGQKILTYYELDLGLNHVVRKWADPVNPTAHLLITVPGDESGPGGVLVCAENQIAWKSQGHPSLTVPIPHRKMTFATGSKKKQTAVPSRTMIVAHALLKMKKRFFFLLQTDLGDLFKLTLEWDKDRVSDLEMKYFDTVPIAQALCLLRSGFLFVAATSGDHPFYQIEGLADEEDDVTFRASAMVEETHPTFAPRPLENLRMVEQLDNIGPVMDAKVMNLTGDDTPQIYALCGRNAQSSLRVLRHGLEVGEVAVSALPGNPNAVFTLRQRRADTIDKYIVVSFVNATLILSIGETVEECKDSGLLESVPTIATQLMGEDVMVQVYPYGIRQVRGRKQIPDWRVPANRAILHAALNERQCVIAMTGGELVYFELNELGELSEHEHRREMTSDVRCVAIGAVPEGKLRSRFLAVGCADATVRTLSLDPENTLEPLSLQALNATASALHIVHMANDEQANKTYLNIGLINGILIRTLLDEITGGLSESTARYMGTLPVKLFGLQMDGQPAMLTLTSRPWLNYTFQNRIQNVPLSYSMLDYAGGFSSDHCPEGIIGVAEGKLKILSISKLGQTFNQTVVPLKFTPRKCTYHVQYRKFAIIESEHRAPSGIDAGSSVPSEEHRLFGYPRMKEGHWASCLRLFDPLKMETTDLVDFQHDEAAFSITSCVFHSRPLDSLLIVGVAQKATLVPRKCAAAMINVYVIKQETQKLVLIHQTPVEDIPYAMTPFHGRLLVGIKDTVRIYDLGKKRLLRKCEAKVVPNMVVSLETHGNRIIAGDVEHGSHFAIYNHIDNIIQLFADETVPRWLTTSCMPDYDTVAGADKFGNFFVSRLPAAVSRELAEDQTGNAVALGRPFLNGAPHRLTREAEFYLGDTIMHLSKQVLMTGARDVLFYVTLQGAIGVFIPYVSKEDVEFFGRLESQLRDTESPLSGRQHVNYRGYHIPVKSVIDGDLCERYVLYPYEQRETIATQIEMEPAEVSKQLEVIRTRVAF